MHISRIFQEARKKGAPTLSLEFFPPKSPEASARLYASIEELVPLSPSFVSVTYGAGGSTRELTHDLVLRLHRETNIMIIPHLTMVNSTEEEILNIVRTYAKEGVKNIMALRGDPPKDQPFQEYPENFRFAKDLVKLIRTECGEAGVGVAGFPEGHPGIQNRLKEMEYFKEKTEAGADYIVTQLFFDNVMFYRYLDMLSFYKINIPVVAGIMPISSKAGLERMAELSGNTFFPPGLLGPIWDAKDDSEVQKIGIEWAKKQVDDLIKQKVAGIHFYTLNQSKPTMEIYRDLNLR